MDEDDIRGRCGLVDVEVGVEIEVRSTDGVSARCIGGSEWNCVEREESRVDFHSHFYASARSRCVRVVGHGLLEEWHASVHVVEGGGLGVGSIGSGERGSALENHGRAAQILDACFPRRSDELALSQVFGEEVEGGRESRGRSSSHKESVQSAALDEDLRVVQVGRILVVDVLCPAADGASHVVICADALPANA